MTGRRGDVVTRVQPAILSRVEEESHGERGVKFERSDRAAIYIALEEKTERTDSSTTEVRVP